MPAQKAGSTRQQPPGHGARLVHWPPADRPGPLARSPVSLSVTAVGKLLAKLGLTPQKPLKRAYERDAAAIEAWKRDTYPSIARRAKKQGAELYFWDESGFRADAVQGTTWGARGRTPVVAVPGQ